jgi:hypothetical protein
MLALRGDSAVYESNFPCAKDRTAIHRQKSMCLNKGAAALLFKHLKHISLDGSDQ